MGILSYAILSYGLHIPLIILPHFKAEQLYIKLDKKLMLQVKRIDVTLSNETEGKVPVFDLPRFAPIIDLARKNFKYLYIDELNVEDLNVTFRYTANPTKPQDNRFTVLSKDINASISYQTYKDHAYFEIDHFVHIPSKIHIRGASVYDFKEESSHTKVIASLSNCADVTLYTHENGKELSFLASSNIFTDLAPIVKLLNFEYGLYKWIVPYNKAGSYQLLKATGTYSYVNSKKLLDTLYIHAQEKDLSYTFQEGFPPVDGLDADIYFTKGVLDVQPHYANYNNHPIRKGKVIIDFNGKDIILSIDLFSNIQLDQDIIDLLESYDIPIPLRQTVGKTDAHVKLFINLSNSEAYAIGEFFVKKSEVDVEGTKYKVQNASLRLHKTILSIDSALVEFKDIYKAEVNGQVDVKNVVGDVYFETKKISLPLFKDERLILTSKSPRINLHFTKDTESYIVPKTQWKLNDMNITVQESEIFVEEKFSSVVLLKDLLFSVHGLVDINASGFYNTSDQYAVLDLNLKNLNYQEGDFNLSQTTPSIPLKFIYKEEQTKLSLLEKSTFLINQNPLHVQPADFVFKNGYLDTQNMVISYNKQLHTYLSTHYKFGSTSIKIKASHTVVNNHDTLYIQDPFNVNYHYVKQKHYLDIPKYKIHATLNKEDIVDLQIRDIQKLKKHSNVLKRYDVSEGNANITYINGNLGVDINLKNFHPLLSENGKNIRDYTIKGNYQNGTANLRINQKLDFLYRKKAKFTAKNIDFNVFEILSYLKLVKSSKEENALDLLIKTKNCNINLGESQRKILADTINIQIKNDDIFAHLVHHDGAVMFEGNDRNFSVHAKGLNDEFMNNLFKFSTFKGGKLSFVMQGSLKELTGVINIEDSVIEDYTVLNNTLAFFNTIPSLVTFSVPGYSKDGLNVKHMYGSFHKHGDIIDLKEAKIISDELIITAKGETNFKEDTIELLMQVKTDIGSSAKDIPIIGYIIFGDDSISTTVRVHGSLHDPIVESSVGKSVVVAPYNILKRALKMPFQVFGLFEDDNSTK